MKIVVFGAGSIGVYVGGSLLAAGADALLIGRARMGERIARHGLVLTDLHGRRMVLDGSNIPYTEDPGKLAEADLILVTVKSSDTSTAADAIHAYAKPSALVMSLQNGVGNAAVLHDRLRGMAVLGGMVPFNVVQMEEGRFHRGTEGELMVEALPGLGRWHGIFKAAHLPLVERADFAAVQWGKLLLNLNNPVNALSGLPLKAELSQRTYRRCLALLIEEALATLSAAGIAPAKVAKVSPSLLPRILRLPDWLFKRLAAAMLRIDPEARSSMWEDLQAGRRTEIDYLNGAVVALARSLGRAAPANERIVELIRRAEAGKGRELDGAVLYHLLNAPSVGAMAKA
ncbi:MAG TPA: 2-dehydropantoate 2-reductase [Noviherbaspirillum sp.]|nr:2-dehydropantoate 2-reductase [Noviherbaspirillum sp.]